jgi:hypothetical protein
MRRRADHGTRRRRTNLSGKRRAGGETLAEAGDAGAHLALVVLEPGFCVLDLAATRVALQRD